jgi:DNA-binding NarL/FixJ family response regulator
VRVLLADDVPLFLEGIRAALHLSDDIEIVGEASNGAEVLSLVLTADPDVVLLGLRMPTPEGLACLERLHKQYPSIKVVVLSMSNDPAHVEIALSRGACGYIVKTINPEELPFVIRQAVNGTVYHAVTTSNSAESAVRGAGLTDREIAVLKAVAQGLSNQNIGSELCVTEQTVKFHLTNIYRKLGVANRTEAARFAYQQGLMGSVPHQAA